MTERPAPASRSIGARALPGHRPRKVPTRVSPIWPNAAAFIRRRARSRYSRRARVKLHDTGLKGDHVNHSDQHAPSRSDGSASRAEAKGEVVDPVCGMIVDPAATRHHASHEGQDYHFCSAGVPGEIRESPQHPLLPRNLY